MIWSDTDLSIFLTQEQLGRVGTVLPGDAGDAGDKCLLHLNLPQIV
jgi:hypothetical protein